MKSPNAIQGEILRVKYGFESVSSCQLIRIRLEKGGLLRSPALGVTPGDS